MTIAGAFNKQLNTADPPIQKDLTIKRLMLDCPQHTLAIQQQQW